MRDEVLGLWRGSFGSAEVPLALFYSDDESWAAHTAKVGSHVCMVGQLARVRRQGEPLAFSADTFGCFGGARFCGYRTEVGPDFRFFLSTGIPGKLEGERYKRTPELVDRYTADLPVPRARGRYIVFKRWDTLVAGEEPLVLIAFAGPDVLSGLFTLANYGSAEPAVVAPFCAGCGTVVSLPLAEAERDEPRAILGMFDVSSRPYVEPGVLTFAAPRRLVERMVADAPGSFLTTPAWERVRRRL